MIKELTELANELDNRGLVKEADTLDLITKEAALPLVLGVISLCLLGACTPVSKDDLSRLGLDFDFEEEVPGDKSTVYDVNPVPVDSAKKETTDNQIILTWPCDNYEVLRELLHLNPLETMDNVTISATWDLKDGYIQMENTLTGRVETC
jgi:hypothetical protein